MKKAFVLVVIFTILFGFLGWKKNKTSMTVVLPEKSLFFIDQDLSISFKKNIEDSIQKSYGHSKNPAEVMELATAQFPEISSMKVQICESDKICFYVDVAEPIFLLNHEFVVCQNGTIVVQDHFTPEIVQNLIQVTGKKTKNVASMVSFVTALPDKLKQEFLIEWNSSSDILLLPKDGKDCILQARAEMVPSLEDLILCQKISSAQKSKTKKKHVYDVRFKNQIIVR